MWYLYSGICATTIRSRIINVTKTNFIFHFALHFAYFPKSSAMHCVCRIVPFYRSFFKKRRHGFTYTQDIIINGRLSRSDDYQHLRMICTSTTGFLKRTGVTVVCSSCHIEISCRDEQCRGDQFQSKALGVSAVKQKKGVQFCLPKLAN